LRKSSCTSIFFFLILWLQKLSFKFHIFFTTFIFALVNIAIISFIRKFCSICHNPKFYKSKAILFFNRQYVAKLTYHEDIFQWCIEKRERRLTTEHISDFRMAPERSEAMFPSVLFSHIVVILSPVIFTNENKTWEFEEEIIQRYVHENAHNTYIWVFFHRA
jgi:hypothetical protein